MRSLTIIFLLTTLFLFSCKKKNPPVPEECEPTVSQNHSFDTIFPSDFISAYPGSWWEYDNGTIETCDAWENVPIRTAQTINDCIFVGEDMLVLPEGMSYYENFISDHYVLSQGEHETTLIYPLLDTVPGVFFENQTHGGSGNYSYTSTTTRESLGILDTMTVGSTTYTEVLHIGVTSAIYYYHLSGGPTTITNYYYAKNVGLIKWKGDQAGSNPVEVELVDHYIAPH